MLVYLLYWTKGALYKMPACFTISYSHPLHNYVGVSVLIGIPSQCKLLWSRLRDSLTYEYSNKSLEIILLCLFNTIIEPGTFLYDLWLIINNGWYCSVLTEWALHPMRKLTYWLLSRAFYLTYTQWIYFLNSTKVHLIADSFEAFIIFSIRHEIRRIDLHKGDYSLLVPGLRNTIALDFHFNQSLLYWTDAVEDRIYRGKLAESGGICVTLSLDDEVSFE